MDRLSSRASVLPFVIVSLEEISKVYFLRDRKAECGIVNLEIASKSRDLHEWLCCGDVVIGDNGFDKYRRRNRVLIQILRVYDLCGQITNEPQTSIRCPGRQGLISSPQPRVRSIKSIKPRDSKLAIRLLGPLRPFCSVYFQ